MYIAVNNVGSYNIDCISVFYIMLRQTIEGECMYSSHLDTIKIPIIICYDN